MALEAVDGMSYKITPWREFRTAYEFRSPREVASLFGLHKSPKPALAFFAGVEYVHVSKAARLLMKHRARETKWLRFTYHESTRDKKRAKRRARRAIAHNLPERAAVWKRRARNG